MVSTRRPYSIPEGFRLLSSAGPLSSSRVRLGLLAVVLGLVFSVAMYPSADPGAVLQASMVRSADRLASLQLSDGTWAATAGGTAGDIAVVGRPGRALLGAWTLTGDRRYLAAIDRAAAQLRPALADPTCRAASTANLLFLAEVAHVHGDGHLLYAVARARLAQLQMRNGTDPESAAAEIALRPNPTRWDDGAWHNYLLWHGSELALLSRAVGEQAWADQFTVALAASWMPKHDYAWWTMGAASMTQSLARVPGARARRLALAEYGALMDNQVLPGLPWNDTPYDSYLYTVEAAASVQGFVASPDRQARQQGLLGAQFLATQQLSQGGFAAQVSLTGDSVDGTLSEETPENDAAMLMALCAASNASPAANSEFGRTVSLRTASPLPHAG